MDANIKTMYTIMAKTEEISNSYKTMEGLATRMYVQFDVTYFFFLHFSWIFGSIFF